MQSVPESRTQTFEEIYGPPENFLEIEVSRIQSVWNPLPPKVSFFEWSCAHLPNEHKSKLTPPPCIPLVKKHSVQTPS